MKRILFSLLILAGYAAANSCTDLIANNNDSFIASGNVHRDSSYFLENGDNAWSHKYTWNDGKLESIRTLIERISYFIMWHITGVHHKSFLLLASALIYRARRPELQGREIFIK